MNTEQYWDKRLEKWRYFPHLVMTPEGEGLRCNYCDLYMPHDGDGFISIEKDQGCTERKPMCQWCGEGPLCAPDCVGIRMLFSDPKVYIVGEDQ